MTTRIWPPVYDPAAPEKTVADYADLLRRLSPKGWVWGTGGRWEQLLTALAAEYARIHGRVVDADAETDPRTATETIAAWERMLGIDAPAAALADRRLACYARMIATGGQSEAYFIVLAAGLGVTITILAPLSEGWNPGSVCGYPLYAGTARYIWIVTAPAATGADIRTAMEALFNDYKPAHTSVYFSYV